MADSCPFMHLPVELRLHIYSFALLDNPAITIGSALLTGPHSDIVHRLYGDQRLPYPGLPESHEPVVCAGYNASLLSAVTPATIPLNARTPPPDVSHEHAHTAQTSLLLVNKQIHDELTTHCRLARRQQTALFLSYPAGLHVCRTLTPHLLRQARSVHIAGSYVSKTFCPRRAACGSPSEVSREKAGTQYHGGAPPDSTAQLGELLARLFGPEARGGDDGVRALELRTYYPGEDSYSTVWGDDASPTVVALRNIYCGEVGIEVWRGRHGTGVYLTARPNGAGERRRTVSTVWRRLAEGERGQPKRGSWVVDERWPKWEQAFRMRDGVKGDLGTRSTAQ
ncbi:hypothetical protein LTR53_011564 [Teratosphaeriaceae sp. CCFEE 6253]|nr:hypothetical protein LTR53_011564 [Teratosphaeriaceae sp. CCFEE 6253]